MGSGIAQLPGPCLWGRAWRTRCLEVGSDDLTATLPLDNPGAEPQDSLQVKSRLRRQGRVPGRSDTENRVSCDAGSGSPAKKPLEQRPQRSPDPVGGDGVRRIGQQAPVTGPVHRYDAGTHHGSGSSSWPCMEVAHRKVAANRGGTTGPTSLVPSQQGNGGVCRLSGHSRSDVRSNRFAGSGGVFAVEITTVRYVSFQLHLPLTIILTLGKPCA